MPFANKEARKEYQREYQRKWISDRRESFFSDKVCKTCGERDNLELHHIDQATKISHSIWSWSEKRRNEEIAKCVVLCHDCHVVETREQRKKQRQHGRTMYLYGCRCEICREAQKLHCKKYYEKIKTQKI